MQLKWRTNIFHWQKFQDVRFAIYVAFTAVIQIDKCNKLCVPKEACTGI